MVMMKKPLVNFRLYREERYLRACYSEWDGGFLVAGLGYFRGGCPLCSKRGRRARNFVWNFAKGLFYCHACKVGGDTLELVKLKLNCSVMDAAKWLEEKAGPAGSGLVVV